MSQVDVTTAFENAAAKSGRGSSGALLRWAILHYRVILAAGAVAGIVTALGMLLLVDRKYEGSAVLAVVSPKISSDLKPASLTVQGYQKLLESDAVLDETRRLLLQQGRLQPKESFRLKEDLETRIFVSRYAENVTLAPMVQLVVRLRGAEQASAAANVWAEVFVRRVRDLIAGSTSSQVKFVDEQYPQSQERLAVAEDERAAQANDLHRRLDELTKTWDEKVLRHQNETADQLSAYESQTKTLIEEFLGSTSLTTRRSQLQALRKAHYDLQFELVKINPQQQKNKLHLEAARKTLAEVNAYVTVRKAITDDALWRSLVAESKEPDWKAIQDRSLLSQEINPVYRELMTRVSQLEVEERAMGPQGKQLEEDVVRISAAIRAIDIALRQDEAKLVRLERERELGLEQLRNKRATELSDLRLDRERHLDELKRERDFRLARLDRVVNQEKDLNSELAKNYNQAILAKAQQSSEEVRLGSPAVPPDRPLPRGIAVTSMMAAFVGMLVGIAIAAVREELGR